MDFDNHHFNHLHMHYGMQGVWEMMVTKESIVSPFFSSERRFIFMALKEPTHQQLIEALDCAMDQWRKFGDEMIEVLKQHPYLSAYLKPLIKKYNESCAEMQEKFDSWPDATSHEKPDI